MRQETQHDHDLLPVPYQSPGQVRGAVLRRVAWWLVYLVCASYIAFAAWSLFAWLGRAFVAGLVCLSGAAWIIIDAGLEAGNVGNGAPFPKNKDGSRYGGTPVACSEVYPGDFASREEYEAFQKTSRYTAGEDVIKEETEAYLAEQARQEAGRVPGRRARVDKRIELEINKN